MNKKLLVILGATLIISQFIFISNTNIFTSGVEIEEPKIYDIISNTPDNIILPDEDISISTTPNIEIVEEVIPTIQEVSSAVTEVIPTNILDSMLGKSLPNIEFADTLSLVTVRYVDYDGNDQIGDLVVHRDLADEVSEIFAEIYEARFPIYNIDLVDKYDADDNLSMINNNTSAFNYRMIAGTSTLSNHSYGRSIDINPLVNPHVIGGVSYPSLGAQYIDRSLDEPGMVKQGDVVYNAFTSRGWSWGGHWNNPDYQHFEK